MELGFRFRRQHYQLALHVTCMYAYASYYISKSLFPCANNQQKHHQPINSVEFSDKNQHKTTQNKTK